MITRGGGFIDIVWSGRKGDRVSSGNDTDARIWGTSGQEAGWEPAIDEASKNRSIIQEQNKVDCTLHDSMKHG